MDAPLEGRGTGFYAVETRQPEVRFNEFNFQVKEISEAQSKADEAIDPKHRGNMAAFYNEWASTYDKHAALMDYPEPKMWKSILFKYFGTSERLLDVCAGTGGASEGLREAGHKIDALDTSEKMLEQAREKELYDKYIVGTVSELGSTEIKADSYDGLYVIGAFGPNHLNQFCLPELIRILKPRGLAILHTMDYFREHEEGIDVRPLDLEQACLELERQGVVKLVDRVEMPGYHGNKAIYFVIKKIEVTA